MSGNIMNENIVDDVLLCRDVSVVLANREEKEKNYIESYQLNNFIVFEDKFWGKCANVHSPIGHDDRDNMYSLSYAYNNFSPLVCSMSLSERMERFISDDAYSSIKFISTKNYKKIWSNGKANEAKNIFEKVGGGAKLKALIESEDGYIYIVRLHTVECSVNDDIFVAESEFDGYPEKLRYFKKMEELGGMFLKNMSKDNYTPYQATKRRYDTPFFLSSFVIKDRSVSIRKHDLKSKIITSDIKFKRVEIWCECDGN